MPASPHHSVTPRVCAHSILSFQAPEMPSPAMQLRRQWQKDAAGSKAASEPPAPPADQGRLHTSGRHRQRPQSGSWDARSPQRNPDNKALGRNETVIRPQHRLAELGNATYHVDFGMRQFAHARCSFNSGGLCSASFGIADVAARLGSILRARSAFRMTATSISSCSKAPCTGVR